MNGQSIGYVVSATVLVYALIYKIPLPCFGCDKGGFWYRCTFDTGYGTKSCSAHQIASARVDGISGIAAEAGEFLDNLWEFTKTELPETITSFISTLKDLILGLKDRISEKISLVITFLKEKISLFLGKITDVVSGTYETFLEKVVNPITSFAMNHIISPVIIIFEKITEFRNMVWTVISNSVSQFANIPIGSFVGDVVDVIKSIPEVIVKLKEEIVKMINNMKNNLINGVNVGIEKSIKGVEKSVNTVSDGIDNSVNFVIGGMNTTKNSIISGINTGINGVSSGIETAVNTSSKGIESVVNNSLNTITGGINKSMLGLSGKINNSSDEISDKINDVSGKVEQGVGKVITSVNTVIGGVESGLGTITGAINTSLNGVKTAIDGVSSGINGAVNNIVNKVNDVRGTIMKIRDLDLGINNRVINWNVSPLSGIPVIGTLNQLDINKVNLGSVPTKTFKRVEASLDIPTVTIPPIDIPSIPDVDVNIPDIDIPNVDIDAPPDINEIDIPHIEIPVVAIPDIPDINPDAVQLPIVMAFNFVSNRFSGVKDSIINLFETAMSPLYDGVGNLIALVTTVVSAIVNFMRDQLSWANIRDKVGQVIGIATDKIKSLKDLVTEEIIPNMINLILSVKEPVLDFISKVSQTVWRFLQKVGMNVADLLKNVYKTVTKITGMVASNVFSMGIYVAGSTIEKYTSFIPLPISVKIALLVISLLWVIFGQFAKSIGDIGKVSTKFVTFLLRAISDLDYKIDKMFDVNQTSQVVEKVASSFMF